MAPTEYRREDLQLRVVADDDESATVFVWQLGTEEALLERITASQMAELQATRSAPSLPALGDAMLRWTAAAVSADVETVVLRRVTIDIADENVGALPWEASVHAAASEGFEVVRTTAMRARSLELPLTLPLRMLEIGPGAGPPIADAVRRVFGSHPQEVVEKAIVFASASWAADAVPAEWPSADIVHVTNWREAMAPALAGMRSPVLVGSIGWFARFAERWQTRLLVLHCQTEVEASVARKLATELVRRGGPAVIVGDFPVGVDPADAYRVLYWNIVHDNPLDRALPYLRTRQTTGPVPALFGGAGREESLRPSQVGVRLLRLDDACRRVTTFASDFELRDFTQRSGHLGFDGRVDPAFETSVKADLSSFRKEWDTYTFDFHERDGLLPLSHRVNQMRVNFNLRQPSEWQRLHRERRPAAPRAETAPQAREARNERYLNASLASERADGSLDRLDASDGVARGEIYQLGLQIGPRDRLTIALFQEAIVEEVLRLPPDAEGTWIELAVVGIDFDVLGEPVQDVWLPRDEETEILYVPVRTRTPRDVAALRVCLYHENQIIQSLRLAALVSDAGAAPAQAVALAAALGVAEDAVKGAGHAVRLEYSLGVEPEVVKGRTPRPLTIMANDLAGVSVVSTKGDGFFGTRINNDVPRHVQRLRDALLAVSFPPIPNVPAHLYPYGFGGNLRNSGDEPRLKAALRSLATPGWTLYDAIFPAAVRRHLDTTLTPGAIVQVAHVLLEKTIPWAALYSRKYDDQAPAPETCLAALETNGSLDSSPCGTKPGCPLHPANIARAAAASGPVPTPDSVVCPRHFWGFQYVVEVPPQQVEADKADARPQVLRINGAGSPLLAAGFNTSIPSAQTHETDLRTLIGGTTAQLKPVAMTRADLLRCIEDAQLSLIYLYCHARGGIANPAAFPPYLEFFDAAKGVAEKLTAADLDSASVWTKSPLVMLNGCGTVGFSPDALSPFVVKLVQDRGAAGVLGTEVLVSEPLAEEIAIEFLRAFLRGKPAGESLMDARRALLAQHNPLGLVYVLYCAADLAVV